jgi:hypothetical protein
MSEALNDIRKDQYAAALRELLRHENDLTNHRIMWLLIAQGFIANAFVRWSKTGFRNLRTSRVSSSVHPVRLEQSRHRGLSPRLPSEHERLTGIWVRC